MRVQVQVQVGSLRQSEDPARSLSELLARTRMVANTVKLPPPELVRTDRNQHQQRDRDRHLMVTLALRELPTKVNTTTLMFSLSSRVNGRTRRHTIHSPTDNSTRGRGTVVNRHTTTEVSITDTRPSGPQTYDRLWATIPIVVLVTRLASLSGAKNEGSDLRHERKEKKRKVIHPHPVLSKKGFCQG